MKREVILSLIIVLLALCFFAETANAAVADYNLSFVSPTPNSTPSITRNTEINISITNASDLGSVNFNWNGTNYTLYNNSLILMLNFENYSALGENNTFVKDLSLRGINATCTGTACPTWNSSGKFGGAFVYDGINDRFQINQSANIQANYTEFTIETWIYANSFNNLSAGDISSPFISDWNSFVPGAEKGYILRQFYNHLQNSSQFQFVICNGTDFFTTASSPLINQTIFSNTYANRWVQVVGVFKGGQYIQLYIDGNLSVNITANVPSIIVPATSTLTYLGYSDINPGYFNGSIDSLRIWNRSLTQAEINEHYFSNLNKYNSNNWSLYINQSFNATQSLLEGNYTYYASVKDSVGSEKLSEIKTRSIDFSTSYSNFLNNYSQYPGQKVYYGNLVSFNASLSDVTGLAGYITGCDFTGNDSYIPISGTSYNLNFTKIANLSEGSVGCCYVWFNDSLGNSNQTSNSCFSMKTRTKININYNSIEHTINSLIFGEGIEASTSALSKIFTSTGYNTTYFPISQTIGFTNLRFAGANCENYDWEAYSGDNSSVLNYARWRNYSMDITGNEPILCIKISDPYNLTKATKWVNDTLQRGFNITYWEMGNEDYLENCNGSRNATCYALRAKEVCTEMRKIKPGIKCGISLDNNGSIVGGEDWNNKVLDIAGNFTDFVVPHYYSPLVYFDTYGYVTSSPQTYNFNVNGANNYSVWINAKSQTCCEASDCYPDLKIQIDGSTVLYTNITTNTTFGVYNTSSNLSLSAGAHNMTVDMLDDYSNSSSGCDKNLWVANLSVKNTTEMVPISLYDLRNWTYSFLASTDTYVKSDLNSLTSNINNRVNHSLNIMITEYNWHYGTDLSNMFSGFSTNQQYDWRQNLFTALMLNTWIQQQNITSADVWSDLATGYWRYASADGAVKYPLYYIINLYSSKTGNYYVDFTTQNSNSYSSSASISSISPSVTNEPFLSIAPSKDTVKQEYDLAIVNRNQDDDELVQINLNNQTPLDSTTYVTTLQGTNLSSHPYIDGIPIVPVSSLISSASVFNYTIPKYSVVFFEVGYSTLSSSLSSILSGNGYPLFKPTRQQLQSEDGYEVTLSKNWQLQFEVNNETHTLKLDDIINKTAIITVSSLPITFNLTVNETKKINLNGDNYYDLSIFLKNISYNSADIIIKSINEKIPAGQTGETPIAENNPETLTQTPYFYAGAIVLAIITILILYLIIKKKKKRK